MVHEVEAGKTKRMSFSKIQETIEIPDLIEIQKDSYARLLKYGLREVFDDISPIKDFSGCKLRRTFEGGSPPDQ